MTKAMANVLAKHKDWTDDYANKCSCGWSSITESTQSHLAAALTAAGFGLVADAKAEALEEAADWLDPEGDGGGSISGWLRERAKTARTP